MESSNSNVSLPLSHAKEIRDLISITGGFENRISANRVKFRMRLF